MMHPVRHVLFLISLLSALVAAGPRALLAHVFPDHSDPRVGSTIEGSPASVRIWFDGALEPVFTTIVVKDSRGQQVDKGKGRVDPSDPTLLETVLPQLPPGTYQVIWEALARDGHRTEGDYTFTVK
jgi:methionine-rich copper-binding protein CopC